MLTEWDQQALRYITSSSKAVFFLIYYSNTIFMYMYAYMYISFYDMKSDVPYQTLVKGVKV